MGGGGTGAGNSNRDASTRSHNQVGGGIDGEGGGRGTGPNTRVGCLKVRGFKTEGGVGRVRVQRPLRRVREKSRDGA